MNGTPIKEVPVRSGFDVWRVAYERGDTGLLLEVPCQMGRLIPVQIDRMQELGHVPMYAYRIPNGAETDSNYPIEQYGLDGMPYHPPGWPV